MDPPPHGVFHLVTREGRTLIGYDYGGVTVATIDVILDEPDDRCCRCVKNCYRLNPLGQVVYPHQYVGVSFGWPMKWVGGGRLQLCGMGGLAAGWAEDCRWRDQSLACEVDTKYRIEHSHLDGATSSVPKLPPLFSFNPCDRRRDHREGILIFYVLRWMGHKAKVYQVTRTFTIAQ